MKFKSTTDVKLFLIDAGRLDLIDSVDESYSPDEELIEAFLKKRRQLVDKIKDFRKSQQAKQSWRQNRKKYMDGIRDFHKSTDGKRFHRNLARFLVSRISNEDFNTLEYTDLVETLKSLSSLPTHLLIDLSYYKTAESQATYEELLDESFPIIYKILNNMYYMNFKIEESDLDMLLRLVDTKELVNVICESKPSLNREDVLIQLNHQNIHTRDKDSSYLDLVKSLL